MDNKTSNLRARFERWAESRGWNTGRKPAPFTNSEDRNGRYANAEVDNLWDAWQAASSPDETSLDERIAHLGSDLAEAVAKDEAPEEGGFDLSAGMFGRHVSAWIRKLAGSPEETPRKRLRDSEAAFNLGVLPTEQPENGKAE